MAATPVRLGIVFLLVNIVGAVVAIVLDLGARLVLGEVQTGDLGIEVLWQGSAISAPPPPLVALIAGMFLTTRSGKAVTAGYVLLTLAGLVMTGGVLGEFIEGISFSGVKQIVFMMFSIALAFLAASIAVASVRELVKKHKRESTDESLALGDE
ncbi:MAG: hypothetical protein ACR2KQ_05985 [Actinomycetota bacterium]